MRLMVLMLMVIRYRPGDNDMASVRVRQTAVSRGCKIMKSAFSRGFSRPSANWTASSDAPRLIRDLVLHPPPEGIRSDTNGPDFICSVAIQNINSNGLSSGDEWLHRADCTLDAVHFSAPVQPFQLQGRLSSPYVPSDKHNRRRENVTRSVHASPAERYG